MFYHKDILSKKSGGLGVIWLAATLGSRTNLKKVSKKEILNVKIRNVCDYLASPPEPMALRLSSTLMVGVTRVYNQQCGFYMSDVNHAYVKLRKEVFLISGDIDMATTIAKRDAITVSDDPILLNGGFDMPSLPAFIDDYLPWLPSQGQKIEVSPARSTPSRTSNANVANISLPDYSPSLRDMHSSSSQMDEMPIFGDGEDLNLFGNMELDWEIADNGEIQPRKTKPRKRRHATTGLDQDDVAGIEDLEEPHIAPEQHGDVTLALQTGLEGDTANAVVARQSRRTRLKLDADTELSDRELKDHRTKYVQRMNEASSAKQQRESDRQVTKTVDVLLKMHLPSKSIADVVAPALYELWRAAGDRGGQVNTDDNVCNVREDIVEDDPQDVEGTYGPLRGPVVQPEIGMDLEVEQPRAATISSLGRSSSMMPWNQMALEDVEGGSAQLSSPSSRPRSMSFSFENMRLPSSRHSSRQNSIIPPSPIGGMSEVSDLAIERAGDGALEGLEAESLNFLQYARLQSIEDLMGDNESVIFAELIPTDGGTRTMAAQAFHHVLALATGDVVRVSQDEAYGEIRLEM